MPIVPVREVGTRGIIRDIPSVLLPTNAWSDGRNVRFDNDSVEKIAGHEVMFAARDEQAAGGTNIEPIIVQYWPRPNTRYYIYGNARQMYRVDGAGNVSNINPLMMNQGSDRMTNPYLTPDGTPTNDPDLAARVMFDDNGQWQSTLFNGGYSVVVNNGLDTPHYITFSSSTPGAPQTLSLTPLPGFPGYDDADGTATAKVIRSFDGILIAGNIVRNARTSTPEYLPGQVLLSAQVATGEGFPDSWTPTAGLTTTADSVQLSVSSPIQEIVSLRGRAFVFTEDSIHYVQPRRRAGGVTASGEVNVGKGCLTTGCAVAFEGQIFVVDKNDIYTTSGTGSVQSVANHIVRDYFFNNLDNGVDTISNRFHYENAFVQLNQAQDEIWICYPTRQQPGEGDAAYSLRVGRCNEALIWNYRENYWTIRDMPNSRSATYGPVSDGTRYVESSENIIFTGYRSTTLPGETEYLLAGDVGNTFADNDFEAYVERRSLELDGDTQTSDWTGELYPKVEGSGTLQINMRGDNTLFNSLNKTLTGNDRRLYKGSFDIEKDYKIDPKVNGRFTSYRISSQPETLAEEAKHWRMASFSFNVRESQDRR